MGLVEISIVLGLLAVIYGFVTSRQVLGASAGSAKMQEIAGAIQEGAQAYLKRQYTTIAMVGVVVAVIVAYFLGPISATGFVVGAILSGVAGFIGMNISVRSNVRTAAAAQTGLQEGLTLAFRAGAITGLLVAGLALLAIAVFFYILTGPRPFGERPLSSPPQLSSARPTARPSAKHRFGLGSGCCTVLMLIGTSLTGHSSTPGQASASGMARP